MKELARYEKHLIRALDCPPDLRKRLVNSTRAMAQDFLAGKPDADWGEVEAFLGDPRELACTMLEGEDQETLARYRDKKRRWKMGVLASLVILCLSLAGLLAYILNLRASAPPVVATETLIIYETVESQ